MWPRSWILFTSHWPVPSYMFCLEFPDFSLFHWSTRSTQRSQYVVGFWPGFIARKGYKDTLAKGKGTWDKVQRQPAASFWEHVPSWVTQDVLNFSSNKLWQHGWNALCQGSLGGRGSVPRVFIWAGHVGPCYLRTYQFQTPRKKAGIHR